MTRSYLWDLPCVAKKPSMYSYSARMKPPDRRLTPTNPPAQSGCAPVRPRSRRDTRPPHPVTISSSRAPPSNAESTAMTSGAPSAGHHIEDRRS